MLFMTTFAGLWAEKLTALDLLRFTSHISWQPAQNTVCHENLLMHIQNVNFTDSFRCNSLFYLLMDEEHG